MESFEIILLLLGCVLISSVFDQVLSRVALPLVQIALGAVVGLTMTNDSVAVFSNPEFFLLLFIAPLLFDESRHADKEALWKNKAMVASLAIGLVIVTMLIVGFVLNLIVPSVPLAAAFALGAALGPTDAAAVAAMGKDVSLSKKQESLLSGEALFNDASGVVSFEFALAAAVTGAFSLADASVTFLFDFFGGIAVGLALAAAVMFVLRRVHALGLETPTVFVLFEVCMPFVTFLAAEGLHVSGILAVVAAGLFMKFYPNALTAESSHYAIASKSVWELLVFAINGIVFVLLGMKLPDVILPTWNEAGSTGGVWLVGLVLLVTALVVGVRFVWVLGMEWLSAKRKAKANASAASAGGTNASANRGAKALAANEGTANTPANASSGASTGASAAAIPLITRDLIMDALSTTLSGPKGAVTLSIVLSLPYFTTGGVRFPERDLLIFLASGVILCTLLLANFVVPLLSPADEEDTANDSLTQVKTEILQNVISELLEKATPETELSTQIAVRAYNDRLDLARNTSVPESVVRRVRAMVLADQVEFVEEQMKRGAVSKTVGERYAGSLERMIATLRDRKGKGESAQGTQQAAQTPQNSQGTLPAQTGDPAQVDPADPTRPINLATSTTLAGSMSPTDQIARKKVPFSWTLHALLAKLSGSRIGNDHRQELIQLYRDTDLRTLKYLDTVEPHLNEEGRCAVSLIRSETQAHLARTQHQQRPEELLEAVSATASSLSALSPLSTPSEPHASEAPERAEQRPGHKASHKANRKQAKRQAKQVKQAVTKARDVEAEALSIELEQIKTMREAGRLSSRDARELREEVYLLQMGLEAR